MPGYKNMTPEQRAEYMRQYRKDHPDLKPHKRPETLDRSKPVGKDVKQDPSGYSRQYMRWKRDQPK